jgi:hypothetical protein
LKITDVESIAAGAAQSLNREGFAILEDVATSMEIAAVARVQSLAGLKDARAWGAWQCTAKLLKLVFSNSLRSNKQ